MSHEKATTWAAISRNLTPSVSSGLPPSFIMLGRANILGNLDTKPLADPGTASGEVLQTQSQLNAVARARAIITASDADHIVRTG